MTSLFPDIDVLVRYLAHHCAASQPAERWAMYRLITPVIDFACHKTGWQPFFEYNQTSSHGTSQSIDIALLEEGVPRVLIEAKRAKRRISRQHIEKYLTPGLDGIVSNGTDWILCRDEDGHLISVWDEVEKRVSRDGVEQVIAFIVDGAIAGSKIDPETDIAPVLRPGRHRKAQSAHRKQHTVESIGSADALHAFAAQNARLSVLDRDFLEGFATLFETLAENMLVEARETRMSVWCFSSGQKDRLMRIEFGKQQPSIIVKTAIVDACDESIVNVAHNRHDKHGGMREFRPKSEQQAQSLGRMISALLARHC